MGAAKRKGTHCKASSEGAELPRCAEGPNPSASSDVPVPEAICELPDPAFDIEEQGVAAAFHSYGDGVVGGAGGLAAVVVVDAVAVGAALLASARNPRV